MRYFRNLLKIILIGFLLWATGLFIYALFSKPILGEAYIGTFDPIELSEGWTVTYPDGTVEHDYKLPSKSHTEPGQTIKFENTLPDDIRAGMTLNARVAMSDAKVAINGRLRSNYGKRNFLTKRVPMSTFIILNLRDEDAGGKIEVLVTPNASNMGSLYSVTYAYGNDTWFPYIRNNIPFIAMGVLMIIAGVASILSFLVFSGKSGINRSVLYLGILTAEIGMWTLGENQLRQLLFGSPFYANIF
ncbi:MAG: hypothetical protein J5910_09530 [Lachnospiraceae bacterium]|nr:hypothetical protein [Lachnospiraceae bacterium]